MVDARLKELLARCNHQSLREAMEYSIFAGGKRLRPLLLLGSYESLVGDAAFGVPGIPQNHGTPRAERIRSAPTNSGDALDFACALEMLHTYSLIHDDLPAMDNDDLRRGKPTSHKQFGEAMAILAGDALLNRAYEVMAANCAAGVARIAAMNIIAQAAGDNGMIAGQVLDINAAAGTLSEIHRLKTGALFKAAFTAGAVLAEAGAETTSAVASLGETLGAAFQLLDDILDITASEEALGKQKSDTRNNKLTYVSVHGMAKARADYERLCEKALEELSGLPLLTDTLEKVVREVIDRKF